MEIRWYREYALRPLILRMKGFYCQTKSNKRLCIPIKNGIGKDCPFCLILNKGDRSIILKMKEESK